MSRYEELGIARPEQFFVSKDVLPAISIFDQRMARRQDKAMRLGEREQDRQRQDVARASEMFKEVDPKTERDIAYNKLVSEANQKATQIAMNISDPMLQQQELSKINTSIMQEMGKYAQQDLRLSAKAAELTAFGEDYVDISAAASELKRSLYKEGESGALDYKGPEYGLEDVNSRTLAAKHFKTDKYINDFLKLLPPTTGIKVVNIGGEDYLEVRQGEYLDANGNISIPDSEVPRLFEGPTGQLYADKLRMGLPKSLQGPDADPAEVSKALNQAVKKDMERQIKAKRSFSHISKKVDPQDKPLTRTEQERLTRRQDRVRNVEVLQRAINGEELSEEDKKQLKLSLGSLTGAKIQLRPAGSDKVEFFEVKVGPAPVTNLDEAKGKLTRGDEKAKGKFVYEYTDASGEVRKGYGETKQAAFEAVVPKKDKLLYRSGNNWKTVKASDFAVSEGEDRETALESLLNSFFNKGDERDIDFMEYTRTKGGMGGKSQAAPSNNNPLGLNL